MTKEKLIELKKQLEIASSNQERLSILLTLSSPDRNKNYQEAEEYFNEAMKIVGDSTTALIELLLNKTKIYLYQNKLDDSGTALSDVEIYFNQLSCKQSQMAEFYSLKIYFLNIKGQYQESVKIGDKAFKQINEDIPEIEKIWIGLGEAEFRQGNIEKAVKNYEEALTVMKRHNLPKEAFVHYNVAVMFAENGDLLKAEKYFELALDAHQKRKDYEEVVLCFGSLANVYSATGQAEKAEQYYQLALDCMEEYTSPRHLFHTLTNYAYFAQNIRDYEKYFKIEKQILELLEKENERKKHASFFYQTNSRVHLELGNYEQALFWIEKAEEIESASNELKVLANIVKVKIDIAKSSGNFEGAMDYYEKYIKLKEELLDESKHKAFEEYEAKYETKLKEREKEILRLQKIELEQKAIRAQLNPHFFFNSLNSINKFILDNDQENASKFLNSFSGLMRKTLENSEETFITIEEEIAFLTDYLSLEQLRFNHTFSFNFEIDEELEEDFIKIPTMLLQPYVENCIKHGIVGVANGKINLGFKLTHLDQIECTIEDNGVGRGSASKSKHKSLGTKLLEDRIVVLKEQYQMDFSSTVIDLVGDNNDALGTKVVLLIPIIND